MTPEKTNNILTSLQNIAVLAECIGIEFQQDLCDTRFKNPAINQHRKRITESAEAIKTHLASVIKNKDREFFGYQHAVEFHRAVTFFAGLDYLQLREFMDGVEEQIKQAS